MPYMEFNFKLFTTFVTRLLHVSKTGLSQCGDKVMTSLVNKVVAILYNLNFFVWEITDSIELECAESLIAFMTAYLQHLLISYL